MLAPGEAQLQEQGFTCPDPTWSQSMSLLPPPSSGRTRCSWALTASLSPGWVLSFLCSLLPGLRRDWAALYWGFCPCHAQLSTSFHQLSGMFFQPQLPQPLPSLLPLDGSLSFVTALVYPGHWPHPRMVASHTCLEPTQDYALPEGKMVAAWLRTSRPQPEPCTLVLRNGNKEWRNAVERCRPMLGLMASVPQELLILPGQHHPAFGAMGTSWGTLSSLTQKPPLGACPQEACRCPDTESWPWSQGSGPLCPGSRCPGLTPCTSLGKRPCGNPGCLGLAL